MEKKKSVPHPPSESEESSSGEEEENEQGFVRSDRTVEDNNAQLSDEESGSDEDDDDEEQDDDDEVIAETQRGNSDEASSSEGARQSDHGEGVSDSDSETSSASKGKSSKPAHQFVVVPRKAENANGDSGKKASASEKLSKGSLKLEASPKKGKDKDSKRNRDMATSEAEKSSSKKRKKESSNFTAKSAEGLPKAKDFERVSKEKGTNISDTDRKKDSKKSAHATTNAEKPERVSTEETTVKKPEINSAKKAAEKGKNDKKSVKNADAEPAKGSLSPLKPKLFTGNDEIVLTSEILHDLQEGVEIPTRRNDGYWSELADRVQERMEGTWTKEQLCDKMKRMKTRYSSMAQKFKGIGKQKFRNSVDQELFAMWEQLWGDGDAPKVNDVGDAKSKRPKVSAVASPVKGVKASRQKATAPVQDMKVMDEESEGHEGNEDLSESDESDGDHDLHKNNLIVTSMEVDLKDAQVDQVDHTLGLENNADNSLSHSASEVQRIFHQEVRMTIAETLKEWQSKALAAVVENAVKIVADQARMTNGLGMGMGGFDVLSMPLRTLDMRDLQLSEGDQTLHQQWHELRLKELEVYCQRLELMQRECQLKQEQMKLELPKSK